MSDAPKDAKKPAAKTEGKPAEAKPAAGKAPAKAAAKGAAKGTAKPVAVAADKGKKQRRPDGPRKKAKPEKKETPASKARKEAQKAKLAATKALNVKHQAFLKARAAHKKAVKEAKKKGLPAPKNPFRVKRSEKKKQIKANQVAAAKRAAANAPAPRRYYLKLSPLNQQFQNKYGFIFSEWIGKAREKQLRRRNVRVVVHRPGNPLNGRVGKLLYYTGKHKAFVQIGHTRFKIPWALLVHRKKYNLVIKKKLFLRKQGRRINDYSMQLRAYNRAVTAAKAAGKPEPAKPKSIAAPIKKQAFVEPKPKTYKLKEGQKPKKAPKPDSAYTLPPLPFKSVGNPHKSSKGNHVQRKALDIKKKREEAIKSGKYNPKKKNNKRKWAKWGKQDNKAAKDAVKQAKTDVAKGKAPAKAAAKKA